MEQADEFTSLLKACGAEVLECPTIRIVPPASYAELDAALYRLEDFDWIIFTSRNTVAHFFDRFQSLLRDHPDLGGRWRICCVGPGTAERLEIQGVRADIIADSYTAEGVIAALSTQGMRGRRVLYPRGDQARDVIPRGLRQQGADVEAPTVYRNILPDNLPPGVVAALTRQQIDCVTFTAPSTITNLACLLGESRFPELLRRTTIASIGPITTRRCLAHGLDVHVEPRKHTLVALTAAIARHFR
jgi:uroporphyrinogen III methyltransferase/synthase